MGQLPLGSESGVETHSKRGHGIQRVAIDLRGYECENEIWNAFKIGGEGKSVVETTSCRTAN